LPGPGGQNQRPGRKANTGARRGHKPNPGGRGPQTQTPGRPPTGATGRGPNHGGTPGRGRSRATPPNRQTAEAPEANAGGRAGGHGGNQQRRAADARPGPNGPTTANDQRGAGGGPRRGRLTFPPRNMLRPVNIDGDIRSGCWAGPPTDAPGRGHGTPRTGRKRDAVDRRPADDDGQRRRRETPSGACMSLVTCFPA
jgi:hypothetical protein